MQKCELPDTDLYVFGMNKKEMKELSLANKYLIGTDGLGSGKDRCLAEAECKKSLPCLEQILADKLVSILLYAWAEEQEKDVSNIFFRKPLI